MPVPYSPKFNQPGNNMIERMLRHLFICLLSIYLPLSAAGDSSSYAEKPLNKQKWEELSNGLDYTEDSKDKPKEKEATKEKNTDFDLSGINVFIKYIGFALIIGIIGYICALIITSLLNKNASIKKSNIQITSEDDLQEENISEWPLQRILNKYMDEGDIRNAIRIYYLMSLQLLHLNGFIKWEKDKTNSKYLLEVSSHPFVADFSALTRIYETSWYGKYIPDAVVFAVIKSQFTVFNNQFPAPDGK